MDTTEQTKLSAIRAALQSRKDLLAAELEGVERDLFATVRVLELIDDYDPNPALTPTPTPTAAPDQQARAVTVEDLQDCKTQGELVKRYGRLNGGVARVGDVARIAHDTGKWTAKESSLHSTIYNYFSKSDEWVWVEPGTFRLRRNGAQPDPHDGIRQ